MMSDELREEYNIGKLHPRKDPYVKKLKQQTTINLSPDTVTSSKTLTEQTAIPYLTLNSLDLAD